MSLNPKDAKTVSNLASLLYNFLPGSGNNNTSFPLVARNVGIENFWIVGSKLHAIDHLLTNTLEKQRHKITPLIEEIVRQSLTWRKKRDDGPTRKEIISLNQLLLKLNFKIPDLNNEDFLNSLPSSTPTNTITEKPDVNKQTEVYHQIDGSTLSNLKHQFDNILKLDPIPRGKAFELFLKDLFNAYKLSAKADIKLVGEQIDGSFVLDGNNYLLEAKWTADRIGQSDLLIFDGKVNAKANWTRGLFISESGFTIDGLDAFARGRRTSIICMDGLDLYSILDGKLNLIEVLREKNRRTAETGRAFVPVRDLFPSVI